MSEIKKIETEFLNYVKKMTAYQEAIHLIYWDLRTGAPKNGVTHRSEVISLLSSEVFQMSTSEEMAAYIAKLSRFKNEVSKITQKTLEDCKQEYDRNKKIPIEEYKDYVMLQSEAQSIWGEAKEKSDFNLFRPYLEKLVDTNKRFIEYWGYEGNKYNTLLDLFEPGVTVAVLDKVFEELRENIVPLVKEVSESPYQPETAFLFEHFSKEKQRQFSVEILRQIGYNFHAGRLDETIHPFAISLNPGDVRVTTNYNEKDFRSAVFGTIHEGGHALYEQNISKELIGTSLCTGTSMGIHESQSLFYEYFIGRHYSFWVKNYDLLKKFSNGQFDNVTLENFYRAINQSKPSLIRIEADELTYPLHIIIRYEIEKGLFNDEIDVKDLPQIWNDKYEEYLGIRPKNDGEGVLQDVHWAGGSFGYFPSYALGYMYAAQFKAALVKDIPSFDELLAKGHLQPIRKWFTYHIHQYGKMKKPLEILTDVTGEGLNAKYLIDYLYDKYRKVYQLI
ncbi:carboxypeptidase M32 [Bacillus aquiflavi]|uniref:Metal-dependent carboxypeptidase n=1 Tax=Bacillus aquiflavi TaxID=2672567 RepID=A0A6B3VTI3_9BACI|nr:carboxypeptidase M32 [Bacillus aquiflavi]MBA4536134.1 carboxypeptidase M32 [Bacillus aquiflavi]NEY80508.1 carboxypeptidase M32 [Bacillus aquiflavi]